MIRRLVRQMWCVLAMLTLTGATHASAASPPTRIVAVGDLHGDYDAWLAIARAAGLVDGRNHWAGGRTLFVQLGDIPDRGPDSLKIIQHLQRLQREARKAGGQVIVLVGNHEAMNVTGDLRYVDPGEYAAFADRDSERRRDAYYDRNRESIEAAYRQQTPGISAAAIRAAWLKEAPLGMIEHRLAWAPDGEVGRWVVSHPAVAKVGDTLFVHGGLSAEYARLPLREINARVHAALLARDDSANSILYDPLGPLWYRGLVAPKLQEQLQEDSAEANGKPEPKDRPPVEQELAQVLQAYGAKRIVVGHTPSRSGIEISHDGRLVRADTGISRHYGGQLAYVEIAGDRVTPHVVPRPGR